MDIGTLMSREPVACAVGDRLDKIAQLMLDRGVGSVVIHTSEGGLAGMVTDRDIALAAQMLGRPLSEIQVDVVMTREIVTARPGDSADTALRLMRERRIRRLPIVEDGQKVVGLLSLDDLAGAAASRDDVGLDMKELLQAVSTTARVEEKREKEQQAAQHAQQQEQQQGEQQQAKPEQETPQDQRQRPGRMRRSLREVTRLTGQVTGRVAHTLARLPEAVRRGARAWPRAPREAASEGKEHTPH